MNPENLGKLLNPRSLAIAGPNDKNNAGAQALANAIASGFQGAIYPVNPNYQSLLGADIATINVRGSPKGDIYSFEGSSPQMPGAAFRSRLCV